MEDRPHFEIKDGAVVHPLICPWPDLSPTELAEIQRAQALAYGADPSYYGERTRER